MAIAANIKRLLDSSSESNKTMENNVNRRRNFCEIVQRHIEGTQLIDLENCILSVVVNYLDTFILGSFVILPRFIDSTFYGVFHGALQLFLLLY